MVESISSLEAVVNEFRDEVAITKRVLERVPGDKLTWKPHQKSMSLGQLAWHVATVPGGLARILQQDSFDVTQGTFEPPSPKNLEEILAAYDQSVRDGEQFLSGLTAQQANAMWHLRKRDKELFSRPRIEVVRTIMLNHWYHHRGQLSVYLRLLEVPVPVIYGRSADEDPFA
ncbi:MAG: DinB family protein [Terriglobales bacterium]